MKNFFVAFLFLPALLWAQFDEYHPDYEWLTIRGKKIFVHYHAEAERTAKTVAKIADEVWGPITSLYDYEPEPVHFIIKDIDDYSNGATYFFDNKIEIWASALDFDLRGSHNWLRNVISHEFTHMVQIQSAMKLGRTIPAIYLQFMNYEDKRRPDILYGFPNFIGSYPIATINVPAWFAEGTAQYMRKDFDYDNWDTHRDMILRSYALDNKMLTWNQMGVFDKTSLGNESVYNSGFALTRYISQKYGEEKLKEITRKLGKMGNFTIDAAFKDVLGKDGDQIYDEWSGYVKKSYKERVKDVLANLKTGKIISGEGFGNFYPSFSPDGKKLLYISNKENDYFAYSAVYELNLDTKKENMLVAGVRSSVVYIPGKNQILYAKLSQDNPKLANIHDLYKYDIDQDKSERLTFGLRANNPNISKDGSKIVFLFQKDGSTNIGIIDADGKNFKRLTFFEHGEQVFNPKFSPDGSYIIFGYSLSNTRDIARVNTDGSGYQTVIKNGCDNRDPVFDQDGNLVYCSDETGISNLYRYNFETKQSKRLSNVLGGAFNPAVGPDGGIIYSGYTSAGFKIYAISKEEELGVDEMKKYSWINNPPLGADQPKGDLAKFNLDALKNYNDNEIPDYEPSKYTGVFSRLSIVPFVRYDNYNTSNSGFDKIKPGFYFMSNDMLNRYSIFGGGSINARMERDLFLSLDFRDKLPLLFNLGLKPELGLELYSISRKVNTPIIFDSLDASQNTNTDVTYNLFEADFIARHKIINDNNNIELRFIYSSYTATLGSFIVPISNILYPTTNDTYMVGRNVQFKYSFQNIKPTTDSDINPVGRTIEFQYNYEFNLFNSTGTYQDAGGYLTPVYQVFDFHRLELNWKECFEIFKDNTLNFQFRAASILGPTVPDFFDYYLGGLVGMKSYPFYSVSGNKLGWLNVSYRFPLFREIDTRIGHLYLDKIYLSVYGDYGNAWDGNFPGLNSFKKGIGAELRVKMNSFYLFPTSLFFNAAYSFDRYSRVIEGETINYGKEWNFYGGILFDFNI
jgi:Tol biopolymer transport system component